MRSWEKSETDAFLEDVLSVPVDVSIARQAGTMLADLRSKGLTIDLADGIIAATALQLGVPRLTNNIDHYPFPELSVVRGRRP